MRARHDAAAISDLFQDRPQCDRVGGDAASTADQRRVDTRDRAPEDTVRAGYVYASIVYGAREGEGRTARGYSRRARPRLRCRDREAFHAQYRPWRQRIAFVPDADLFQAIKSGKASVVTDEIDRFTETGILLKSGKTLDAAIIITATGFNLNVLGDIGFTIDGKPLDFAQTVTYRGMMFTGVPNMVWVFGYFRASWTLRTDLVADFVCRLLAHMKKRGAKKVVTALRREDQDMPLLSWIDPENFNPGYLMRDMHLLPKRGDKPEWQHSQDYWAEKDQFRAIDLDNPAFVYD